MNAVIPQERAAALRRAIVLEQVSILWMCVEGAVAIASGLAARSLALAAFGWDSLIEMVTAAAVLWRVVVEARGADRHAARRRADAAESVAARIVAASLLALALYILIEAVLAVRERRAVGPAWGGLIVSAAAVVGMPVLYRAKRAAADTLDSEALREDAFGNLACAGMGAITLAGLAAQRAGVWWADPAAALVLAAIVAREGVEAWERASEARGPSAPPVRAYLALGSNLGDRREMLAAARTMLDAPDLSVLAASRVYESAPWGVVDQPRFLNQVLEVDTTLSPRELLQRCHEVEARLGRVRAVQWGPRTIDVDILLYDAIRVCEPDLIIPHAQLSRRAFVLVPLAELNPGLRVPARDDTIQQLLDALPDRAGVTEYS